MSDDKAYTLPAPDAPAEDWGRLAVSLPGWRWMPGMLGRLGAGRLRVTLCGGGQLWGLRMGGQVVWSDDGVWPDPDDPATAGCLLVLAGAPHRLLPTVEAWLSGAHVEGMTLGRACIADVRDQWGRWPGGEG